MSHIIISTAPTYEPFMLYKKEMGNVMPFIFDGKQLQVVVDDKQEPFFILKEICDLLGLQNPSKVSKSLDELDVTTGYINSETSGNKRQEMILINESGLYQVIFQSRKKEAIRFKRWVTSEVIPSIRKTGSYNIKPLSPAEMLLQQAQLMVQQEQRLSNVEEDIKKLKASQITSTIEYYTISGYCSLKGLKITPGQANLAGRRASKLSREHDIEVGKVGDSKYGQINSYHIDILDEVFR